MRIMLIFGLVFISMGLSTCKKEPPIEPKPPFYQPPPSVLETVWTTPLQGFSINPMLNSNGDVLMSSMFNNSGKGEIIKLFDKNTGQLKWEWSDYLTPEEGFSDGLIVQKNDVLVLSARKNNYALDMITGQTIWKNTIDSMSAEPQIYQDEDGYLYKGFHSYSQPSTVYIFRTLYNTGNWELVCTYTDKNPIQGRFEIASIGVSKNTKGEKIVAFTIYTYYPDNRDSTKALIVGYNLSTQSFDWEKNYRNVLAEFTVAMYTNNKGLVYPFAFGYGQKMLVAIDVNNGEIVWQKNLPDLGAQISFYKDNLIVTSIGQSPVYCYNQTTGSLIWQQLFTQFSNEQRSELNFDFGESVIFKNYHLSTQCGKLLILDADNGSVLFYDNAALPEGCLQHGLAIDEKRRVFYVEDRLRALCYKLPDVVKY
jgi:outer membrane protein assembly factor BamB